MLIQAGYPNAKALKGGVAAWQEAGFSMVGQG
jgi:rhodanese-related sulfurtransferase